MLINEDGYRLWLRYQKINDDIRLLQYRKMIDGVTILENEQTFDIIKYELDLALPVILDKQVGIGRTGVTGRGLVVGTIDNLRKLNLDIPELDSREMGNEGFLIRQYDGDSNILITANSNTALITGMFHFLRRLQTHHDIQNIDILNTPRIHRRLLCHWDNIDGSIERGYAGRSLWK